jgi:glycosyltransferase involved in cell wall biosynthesis
VRVLFVTDWPPTDGGVETYLTQVSGGLAQAGDEVALLASSVGAGRERADYVAPCSDRPAAKALLQIANPGAARTVRRAVAEFRPDVAHVTMFELYLSPGVLLALGDVPTLMNVAYYKTFCPNGLKLLPDDSICGHRAGAVCLGTGCVGPAHWLRDQARYARIRRAVRRAAAAVTCSRYMQAELRRAQIDADWFPWPVLEPRRSFRRVPAAEPLFVYAGRLSREKGVSLILDALARLRREGVAARLRIVGDGRLRARLEEAAAGLGVGEIVDFVGRVEHEEMDEQLADAWAVVAPSLWAEPLGLTPLEAIVRGVPVIGSATGGIAETVEDGRSGLLFPNGDAGALADRMRRVAQGELFADHAVPGEVVRRTRERHGLERHVDGLRARLAATAEGVPLSR